MARRRLPAPRSLPPSRPGSGEGVRSTGLCTDSEAGRDLLLYELEMLTEEEVFEFEAHLLECDHCFDRLHALDRSMDEALALMIRQQIEEG